MAGSCLLRSTNPGAITIPQFLESFKRVWLESRAPRAARRRETRLPRRIGLAVSGGADSMALAYLCRQWEKTHSCDDVAVTAFVVDHKAREESSREAATVTRWLTDLGIRTQVLELSWPWSTPSEPPSQVSAFETHARRLRFQALGTACRDHRIEALLMGHHQDDNVETTLWRLCSGSRGAGLAGIPSVNPIPECHGLFGVAESGSSVTLRGLPNAALNVKKNRSKSTDGRIYAPRRAPMSTGGIFICRPLLSFPKASLLATCHDNNVPYVSDPTNFDPTLTARNAIRHLVSSDRLPRALQTPSVLSLVKKSQDLIRDTAELSNELLQNCKILDLNLATGTMTLQFPFFLPPAIAELTPSTIHQIQTVTLRRITDLISPFPESHFPLRSFEGFTSRVFHDPILSSNTVLATERQAFTLGGVMVQPINRHPAPDALKQNLGASQPSTTNNDYTHTDIYTTPKPPTDKNNIWYLSRQPFRKNCLPTAHLDIPIPTIPSPTQNHPKNNSLIQSQEETHPSLSTETENQKLTTTTPWILWDDRYWLRLSIQLPMSGAAHQNKDKDMKSQNEEVQNNNTKLPLLIRPLLKSDIQLIRQVSSMAGSFSDLTNNKPSWGANAQKKDKSLDEFLERLAREAPGLTRFTLPLVVIPKGVSGLEEDLPLALPTMEQGIPGAQRIMQRRSAGGGWEVHWEWMYKMVDTEPLKLMGGLEEVTPLA